MLGRGILLRFGFASLVALLALGIPPDCGAEAPVCAVEPPAAAEPPAVECDLPIVRGTRNDCSGWHRIEYSVSGATPDATIRAELLALDADGELLQAIPVEQGDLARLASRLDPDDWKIDTRGSRRRRSVHTIFAPAPVLRVTVRDRGSESRAYCSNIPFLDVIQPSAEVVSASPGAITEVTAAIPQIDPTTLTVNVDGVDVLAALGLDPTIDFPGGPFDGPVLIDGEEIAIADLIVRSAPLGQSSSNTLTMKLSDLGAGGHVIQADAAPLAGALPSPRGRLKAGHDHDNDYDKDDDRGKKSQSSHNNKKSHHGNKNQHEEHKQHHDDGYAKCLVDDLSDHGSIAVFGILIDDPQFGVVVDAAPTRVLGEVRHGRPIVRVEINGIEQDVSGQLWTPGSEGTFADQYAVVIDTDVDETDLARDIAGLTTDVGTFDPGSNRLIVAATDDQGNRAFLTHTFAVGDVASVEVPPGSEAPGVVQPSAASEVENALALGIEPAVFTDAFQEFCALLTPEINALIRGQLKVCSGGERRGKICADDSQCTEDSSCEEVRICDGGSLGGVSCVDDSECPDGGSCKEAKTCDGGSHDGEMCSADSDCEIGTCDPRPPFASKSKVLALNTPTHCDPSVAFGINFDNIPIDALHCSATFENGLLTLNVQPQIRALELYARGECGICVDIGSETLESVAVGVNLELAVNLGPFRISLRDWQNTQPIDAEDPAYVRFLEDSLTTPAVEKARIAEARIRDFLSHPLSQQINDQILDHVVGNPDLRDQIDAVLDPSAAIVESLRRWLAEEVAGFASTTLEQALEEAKFCDGGSQNGASCVLDLECPGGSCKEVQLCDGGCRDGASCANDSQCPEGGRCKPAVDRVCDGGSKDGASCMDDSQCPEGGSCRRAVDRFRDEFALDSFRTFEDGLAITVKGKFGPSLIDPEVEATPWAVRTPAPAPPALGDSFLVVADDTFNQIFASMTLLGDIQQHCFAPDDPELPNTVGDYLASCDAEFPGAGICVGILGGDCEALATPVDEGNCHGVRGDDCDSIPVSALDLAGLERESCNATPAMNLTGDMPVHYCVRADVPPSLWIRDDPIDVLSCNGGSQDGESCATDTDCPEGSCQPAVTPDRIETNVRLNDLLVGVVVDREADGVAGVLSAVPGCADKSADPSGDCLLSATCLDLNLPTDVILKTTDQGDSKIKVRVQSVQMLDRPAGAVCAGALDPGTGDPLGEQNNLGELTDALMGQINGLVPNVLPALPLPLVNPRIIAVKTSGAATEFEDYVGLASVGRFDPCGNGTCDEGESCGTGPGSCTEDCDLCGAGEACDAKSDCESDHCVANICRSPLFTELNSTSCDGACLIGGDCSTGVCNFGICTPPNSLPALAPCSTGAACKNGSCTLGHCEEICGDTFCDGTEICGRDDGGLSCRTDCDRCSDGTPCVDNDSCASGVCNGTCVAAGSVETGEACIADAACRTGICLGLVCVASCGDGICEGAEQCGRDDVGLSCRTDCNRCANGHACLSDNTCQSGNCALGICRAPCSGPGAVCALDSSCCSASCSLLTCD